MSVSLSRNEKVYSGAELKTVLRNYGREVKTEMAVLLAWYEQPDATRPWQHASQRVVYDLDEDLVAFDHRQIPVDEIGFITHATSPAHVAMYEGIVRALANMRLTCVVLPDVDNRLRVHVFADWRRLPITIIWLDDAGQAADFRFLYLRHRPDSTDRDRLTWSDVSAIIFYEPIAVLWRENDALRELIDAALSLRKIDLTGTPVEKMRRLVQEFALAPGSTAVDTLAVQFAEKVNMM